MTTNDNVPLLSTTEESRAPWNEESPSTQTVNLEVSITIYKTIEVEMEKADLVNGNFEEYTSDIVQNFKDKNKDWKIEDVNYYEV